jgi:menaquinone-dependent protoporphyrinogen oxidase
MSVSEPRILVAYHSVEGQAAKVAQRIAETMRTAGADVEVREVDDAPPPGEFDAVVVGDSIHVHHSRALRHYVDRHVEALNAMPAALFQVSMASATDDDEHERTARKYVSQLLDESGFDPDAVGMFAGALMYTKYGWIKRHIMRSIEAKEGRDVDTTRDYEYTDWDAVDEFATAVLALVATGG